MADSRFKNLHKALKMAGKVHRRVDRDFPDPIPYITHINEVVSILRIIGGVTDEEMLCAGALHDAIEHGKGDLDKIDDRFGKRVARLVRELTRKEPDSDALVGLTTEEISELRFQMLLKDVEAMSDDAKAIKLADRLSNLLATKYADPQCFDAYAQKTRTLLGEINKEINPHIWEAIDYELPKVTANDNSQ